eukprot:gnl/TRDRNA2_/TRDRNA2_125430_c0_seq1.p1 gnl/TRDRNA2_/TRDRNA2_125430_c0~~gnl/TRDRNA2_/TRDRNA2_125430_c0_seq1.p1  ORF type:complete len:406 (-),score=76.33 gnl/TRDRNA2_/TRDRNA2_125430_c0_seq1:62-1279(-)
MLGRWRPITRQSGRCCSRPRRYPAPVLAQELAPSILCRHASASTESVLQQARNAARDLGVDPAEVYEPWWHIDAVQQALLALHGMLGDPGLVVVSCALLLRIGTWPLNRRSLQRSCDRLELAPIYMALSKATVSAKQRQGGKGGGGAAAAEKAEADLKRLHEQAADFLKHTHFSPLQGMGYQFLVVAPTYMLIYFALRGIIGHPDSFRGIVTDPTLWIDSLVLTDPYGVLPVLSAVAVLANAEVNSPKPQEGQEENAMYFRFVIRGACLAFVPVTSTLPAGMLLFMAANASYTALVTYIYRKYLWVAPRVDPRWWPATPVEDAPHRTLRSEAKEAGADMQQFQVNQLVRLKGLKAEEFNSKVGRLELFDSVAGRWQVRLDGCDDMKAVKVENLERLDDSSGSKEG